MNKRNLNTNSVPQKSSQVAKFPLNADEKNINLKDLNMSQNNQTLTNLNSDLSINQLNFEEIYAQYHCMDSEHVQLTPQQYQETIIGNDTHTIAIKNILHEFFANGPPGEAKDINRLFDKQL
eukprot:491120_1